MRFLLIDRTIPVRLHLLGPPLLTLELLPGGERSVSIPLISKNKQRKSLWGRAFSRALRIRLQRAEWIAGIEGDAAATALLCGVLEALSSGFCRASALPAYQTNALRLNLEGIICVRAAEIIRERLRMARAGAANRLKKRPA